MKKIIRNSTAELVENSVVSILETTAKEYADSEFEKYRIVQDRLFESDFDKMVKEAKSN